MAKLPLPMIYTLKYDATLKTLYYLPTGKKFPLPSKIYGSSPKIAYRVWNDYVTSKKSTGILLTGIPGSGKSNLGSILANTALENGMGVLMLSGDIKVNNELISILNDLENTVIFIDEFGKIFNRSSQELMLTMFSDMSNNKKIFILTENKANWVSEFILNRPGRIRYHIDFERIDKETYDDYIRHFNITADFKADLDKVYASSRVFCFDHLQALVTEHLKYPNEKLEDMLSVLNLSTLVPPTKYKVLSFKYNGAKSAEFNVIEPSVVSKKALESYDGVRFYLKEQTDSDKPSSGFGGNSQAVYIGFRNCNSVKYHDNKSFTLSNDFVEITFEEMEDTSYEERR